MTRENYKAVLVSNGFVFEKTQKGYPGRGDEDVYSHPSYKYKFYVTRYRRSEQSLYGFYTGEKNGETLDSLIPRNVIDDFRNDRSLEMWAGNAFIDLMQKISKK